VDRSKVAGGGAGELADIRRSWGEERGEKRLTGGRFPATQNWKGGGLADSLPHNQEEGRKESLETQIKEWVGETHPVTRCPRGALHSLPAGNKKDGNSNAGAVEISKKEKKGTKGFTRHTNEAEEAEADSRHSV